jgi:hypothetical protein
MALIRWDQQPTRALEAKMNATTKKSCLVHYKLHGSALSLEISAYESSDAINQVEEILARVASSEDWMIIGSDLAE